MKAYFLTILSTILAISNCFSSVTILNGLSHLYSGNSGDIIEGEIVLLNSSDKNQRVSFYLNDAVFSCEKGREFKADFSHSSSSTDWFNGEVTEKVIAPREKYVFKFSLEIPNDPSLHGSYWTILMVSVDNPIREEQLESNIGLDTKIRYAVGLLTQVNKLDEVDLDFKKMELIKSPNPGQKTLSIQMKNLGKFIETVSITLEIYNKDGEKVKELRTDRNLVFPNSCKTYDINLSTIPSGDYDCVIIADSRESFIGTNTMLTLE